MKPERRIPAPAVAAVALVALLLGACSGSAPSIDEMKWKVVLRDDGKDRYEQLVVFARFSDPDSGSDPALATVSVGDTDLFWQFERELWSEDSSGAGWWGLPPMAAQGGFRLPDGGYTLRLEDLAGRFAELEFRPDPSRPRQEDLNWPEVRIDSGLLETDEDYTDALLVLRDSEGAVLESLPAVNGINVPEPEDGSWEIRIPGEAGSSDFLLGPYLFEGLQSQ